MTKTCSFATHLLRAHYIINLLCFRQLFDDFLLLMLSIILYWNDLKEFHGYMLLWSLITCWYYALWLKMNAGLNYDYLLKLHILQQSRKTIFEEMASSSDVVKPEVFDGANFKRWQAKTKLWLTDLKLSGSSQILQCFLWKPLR